MLVPLSLLIAKKLLVINLNFDNHVFSCAKTMDIPLIEPFFTMYAFLKLNDYNKLRNYERKMHAEGHDTMNR